MEIIPVLDLKAGRVVHAKGGARSNYRPVQSLLSPDGAPLPLVQTLLDHYTFKRLYLADLDAIAKTGNHVDEIRLIQKSFPHLELWIDSGIRTAHCLNQFYRQLPGHPVIGSETLDDPEILGKQRIRSVEPVLSLDFNAEGLLGPEELENDAGLWPENVIIMSLDHVGMNHGPDFSRLQQLKKLTDKQQLYAAGGVRNDQDLSTLAEAGINGVLVATALHNGEIKTRLRVSEA